MIVSINNNPETSILVFQGVENVHNVYNLNEKHCCIGPGSKLAIPVCWTTYMRCEFDQISIYQSTVLYSDIDRKSFERSVYQPNQVISSCTSRKFMLR